MTNTIFEHIEILDAGSEGKAIAKIGDLVIFVPFVVPGDVVDIQLIRKKKSYLEGKAIKFHSYSEKRQDAFCEHFGTCGGCRWQNMKYEEQLFYKQKQVKDAIQRIGKIENALIHPILQSPESIYYRNKLEYSFSNHRWLTSGDKSEGGRVDDQGMNALGFHIPLLFDKILDINHCYLQADPSNEIRLEARKYALEQNFSFYDARTWKGFMRNLLIRTSLSGEVMVILVFQSDEREDITMFLDHLLSKFPQILSLYYVINGKKNDVITDLPFIHYKGEAYLKEMMTTFNKEKEVEFHIRPASFFQTNTRQAFTLYHKAGEAAGFRGDETVYDIYCGIGTISSYIAGSVKKVIGIESVSSAVEDARENALRNGITNTSFFAGEAEKLLTAEFFAQHGKPDVIITDPPRAGMHEKVVKAILQAAPQKIVYMSCNPATQARDLFLMKEQYDLVECQPVDMFPHTQHVENIALLARKSPVT
ncbi:MAG: 23S rRNA (uracil(1939)-C(5))-methyltransferase RlmD [Bacteroidetes bacterium]|nr:23S rRNA (uracil(1939)-C(5))-methyltransferase RlmD [Bacteroidota bacterium]